MRPISRLAGLIGMLLILLAVIGRFYQEPTITLLGHRFKALSVLVMANTFLVVAIYFHLQGWVKSR
jgi:hypothetical protein